MNIRLWDFKIGSDKQIVPIKRVPINESLLYFLDDFKAKLNICSRVDQTPRSVISKDAETYLHFQILFTGIDFTILDFFR